MAKLQVSYGAGKLEVEGDAEAVSSAALRFYQAVAEHHLREVEEKLLALRPLQKQKRTLEKLIAETKMKLATPTAQTIQ